MKNSRVIAVFSILLAAGLLAPVNPSSAADSSIKVVAVGDIAYVANGAQNATAALSDALNPELILLLGDLAYNKGSKSEFKKKFIPSWGPVVKAQQTIAVPGNHEYKTSNANGYRSFIKSYGLPKTGNDLWSVKNIGEYTIIGLDSEGLGKGKNLNAKGKREKKFLTKALLQNNGRPTIVMWHRPRFSTGEHGDQTDVGVTTLWNMVAADTDVKLVLWGHDHDFETGEPTAPTGRKVPTMVIGTGGAKQRECTGATCIDFVFGVTALTLKAKSIDWEFRTTEESGAGKVRDSGTISW